MIYTFRQRLLPIGKNRPGTPLNPEGIIIHETATPGATDEREADYFHSDNRNASAHYFVDYDSITQLIPENEQAWHAGPTANKKFLSIEMCHFNEADKFIETWKRSVWLAYEICQRYKFIPGTHIQSHDWISKKWGETDHTDPIDYFEKHGKQFYDFIKDVEQLQDYRFRMGWTALEQLSAKQLINNPNVHIETLKQIDPNKSLDWLTLHLLNKLADRLKPAVQAEVKDIFKNFLAKID